MASTGSGNCEMMLTAGGADMQQSDLTWYQPNKFQKVRVMVAAREEERRIMHEARASSTTPSEVSREISGRNPYATERGRQAMCSKHQSTSCCITQMCLLCNQ
jgi:hypothetical protein